MLQYFGKLKLKFVSNYTYTASKLLRKPCICCRRADVLEQTSSRNPGKRLAAEFEVSA